MKKIDSPFAAYASYLALVRHFTSDYDFEQYNGKVRARLTSFAKRRDQYWFDKIAQHHDPLWLMIASLVENPHAWVGEIARAHELYARRKGRVEALEYTVRRDLEGVPHDRGVMAITSVCHPDFVRRVLAEELSLETAAVVSAEMGCGRLWSGSGDLVLREVGLKLVKYATFVKPSPAARAIVRDHFAFSVDTAA